MLQKSSHRRGATRPWLGKETKAKKEVSADDLFFVIFVLWCRISSRGSFIKSVGFSNVDDQDITKDYFRASEELVVLVAFITSGSGSAMMLAATSWFFAFDLYKLKIEEGRCPPESLFWTNHAFSLSLSHQRGQGGSSLALHSIFHKTEYRLSLHKNFRVVQLNSIQLT